MGRLQHVAMGVAGTGLFAPSSHTHPTPQLHMVDARGKMAYCDPELSP